MPVLKIHFINIISRFTHMNSSQYNDSRQSSAYLSLWQSLQRLFNLEVDNAKMLVTEKMTLLTARLAICFVVFVVGTCTLIFASMGVADILLEDLPPRWTYLIIAGFYALVIVILITMRRRIFVNPIARFMSRVILDPPTVESGSGLQVTDNNNAQD